MARLSSIRKPGDRRGTSRYIQPFLAVAMTDLDIVERVAKMFGTSCRTAERRPGKKQVYATSITGKPALALLFTLFPYFGSRRRAKIEQTLSKWEHAL